MFRRTRWSILKAALLVLGAVPILSNVVIAADLPCPDGEEILYASADLRIFCTADRQGRRALLLTNLDTDGERLLPGPAELLAVPDFPETRRLETAPPAPPKPEPAPRHADTETVEVVLRSGDGIEEERTVEVRRKDGDAATIVINIDNRQSAPPPAPPPASPVAPVVAGWSWPAVGWAGLPVGYSFPEHYHFLGVSHDNSYPQWFGGLAFGTSRYASLYTAPEKPCPPTGCPPKESGAGRPPR